MNIFSILIICSIIVLIHWIRKANEDSSPGNLLWILVAVIILITNILMYAYTSKEDSKGSEIATETLIVDEK